MFISPAYAQAAGAGGASIISTLLPLVLIMAVFWFLLIRPQQKRAKEHQEMVKNLKRGDNVVTSGGIYGKITKVVNENEIMLEIADGVRMKMQRNAIAALVSKTQPAKK